MSPSTETQRNFLRAVDPLVRKAITGSEDLGQIELTDPQREAIIEGIEENNALLKQFFQLIEEIPEGDRALVVETAQTLTRDNEEPKIPVALVRVGIYDPERYMQILDASATIVEITVKMVNAGLAPRVLEAFQQLNTDKS